MEVIQTILALIVTLGILVTIHEYGHFLVARKCGVKVLRFSVGFGNPIYSWYDRHGTEFAIAAIPLGGYVKMLDEREGPVASEELDQAFTRKTPGQRIAIASAGPIANFLFAIAAYWILAVVGFTTVAPVIGGVDEGSVAARLGLSAGSEVVAIDGRSVSSWRDVGGRLLERAGESSDVTLTVREGGQEKTLTASLAGWQLDGRQPDPISRFGIEPWRPEVPAVLGHVADDGRARQGGLQAGDRIKAVNGQPVGDWFALVEKIQAAPEESLRLTIERDGQEQVVSVTPKSSENEAGETIGLIGAGVSSIEWPEEYLRTSHKNPVTAIPWALGETWSDIRMTLVAVKKMVTGLLSPETLSGPITIARVAEATVSSGFQEFMGFLAYLSISLGILNLLPVPVLDGGHILYYGIEAIRRKPLSEQAQAFGMRIGLMLILTIMLFALYNDLMRL